MNHTPTPYAHPVRSMDGKKVIIDTQDGTIEVFGANKSETATFVHRACNSHETLLKILKEVANDLAWGTTGKYKGTGSAYIFTAIAEAEGK